jgi:nucleoside-diphosphate-sugar epimerase
MNVAILGCGLVGIDTALQLRRAGHRVTGTTTRAARVPELARHVDRAVVLRGDDEDGLAELCAANEVVIVSVSGGMFAEAGRGTVRSTERYREIYIDTARTLVRVLERNRTVKQVIYTSAETVYSGIADGPIEEERPLAPQVDAPTQAFIEAEAILAGARREGRPVCILRLGIVYGRRFSMELMIELARKGPVPFSGDSVLTFVHVRDVARALAHAVERGLDGIYNVDTSACYFEAIGRTVTNKEFFDELGARQAPPLRTEWLGLVKGWGAVANAKLRRTGFEYEIVTPYYTDPEHADVETAVARLCTPMRDDETGRFSHSGVRLRLSDAALEPLLGVPFLQELRVRSERDEEERLMSQLLGVMQKGPDPTSLLLHYHKLRAPAALAERLAAGDTTVRPGDIGEAMYTMTLGYHRDDDCYRGDQRYPVKLHHLIGMMPADAFRKMFAPGERPAAAAAPPAGLAMPTAEWHVLELHPAHAMYLHAFLAHPDDAAPMPTMGMQRPFRFTYVRRAA